MALMQEYQYDEITYLQDYFETASPQDILRWATDEYQTRLAVVTSFQPTGIVTLHMLQSIAPQTAIMTLDTGFLFPETYTLIDQVEAKFNLNLTRVKPAMTPDQQASRYGDKLWQRDPDECCHIRKTVPLKQALHGFDAWITGLRRDQSPHRASTPVISWDERNNMVKICPFANWTEEMIWTYTYAHNLPYNTLHDQGYPSIGCTHCTRAVQPGEDARSGRWVGRQKTECGIHVQLVKD